MRQIKIITSLIATVIISFVACNAQPNEKIVDYFKKKTLINPILFVYVPQELIQLCNDSLGRTKFDASINWSIKSISSSSPEETKEMKVLWYIINNEVKNNSVEDIRSYESKKYIEKKLQYFKIDFKIDENLLLKRFNAEDEGSYCTTCNSMLIFFEYNPELYVQVRSKEKGFSTSKVHFPNAYIIQDCNIPAEIREKRKSGLLNRIKEFNTPIMKEIFSEIKECDIHISCD